jgi:hypothetical protein
MSNIRIQISCLSSIGFLISASTAVNSTLPSNQKYVHQDNQIQQIQMKCEWLRSMFQNWKCSLVTN